MIASTEETNGVRRMSKKTQVKILKSSTMELPTEEQAAEKRQTAARARKTLSTLLPDKIANSSFWIRNQPLPKAKELFPMEHNLQYCEVFYPYAEGGPLYIDMPVTEWQIKLCQRKLEAMRSIGVRYIYLTNQATENDAWAMLEGSK